MTAAVRFLNVFSLAIDWLAFGVLISTGMVLPSGRGTTASVPCKVAAKPAVDPDNIPPSAALGGAYDPSNDPVLPCVGA